MNRKSTYLSLLFVLALVFNTSAQIDSENQLDDKFEKVIDGSNNFKEYKVIKKAEISKLRRDVNAYAKALNEEIVTLNDTITAQQNTIGALRAEVQNTDEELVSVNAEKDNMSFLGIQTSKAAYHATVWGIIAILVLALIIFVLKFKGSNATTRTSLKQLKTTEEELEDLRRRSIEKEQKLGRQLQDERNKVARLKAD